MQADAEHQQHHTDFGELAGQSHVRDKSRRVRADQDAGDEIADQRRQFQPRSREAKSSASPKAAAMVVMRLMLCGTMRLSKVSLIHNTTERPYHDGLV